MLFKTNTTNAPILPYNWPVVSTLLFLTGIAAIPAMFAVVMVAIGGSGVEGDSSFINHLHFATPSAMFVHGGSGILFFLTMPFQFSPRVRMNNLKRHKLAGRVAVVSGCVMALSGIWMHNVLSPESQGTRYSILIITSVAICICFLIAVWHIKKGNIHVHQLWMARAVAIVLAAITPLFIDIIIVLVFSHFEAIYQILIQFQYDYGRLLGIVINLAIVEMFMTKRPSK